MFIRQLVLKDNNSHSWFTYVNGTLTMYDFESIFDLLNSMPSKDSWKNYVRNKIETYWRQKILKIAKGKSTLCFLHPMSMKVCSVHNVWASTGLDCTRLKLATNKLATNKEICLKTKKIYNSKMYF
jgi:hypothetical protein